MKRREFVKISAPLSLSPLLVNGIPVRAFATENMVKQLCEEVNERVLIVIHLNGGNDGINNLIPVNQYDIYANHRPKLKLPENKISQLDTTLPLNDQVYFHPELLSMKELYDNGQLNIVQAVGYPGSNGSHFKSRELWLEGNDGATTPASSDGWIARYLNNRYPNYAGKPFEGMLDPIGVILGNSVKTGFHSTKEHALAINLSGQDPDNYFSRISSISGNPPSVIPDSDYGDLIEYILGIESSLNFYAARITEVFQKGKNSGNIYPEKNKLADQLKTIARLLDGGSQTKVFMCNYGGFDNHGNQVEAGNSLIGDHANRLKAVSSAMKAFQDDLAALQQDRRVLTVIFSEFGRKVKENGNRGTDHGTLGPVYVIGKGVKGGVIGTNLDLNNINKRGAPDNGQIQHDYRQIFGTILQDWLGADETGLKATRFDTYSAEKLDLIDPNFQVQPDCLLNVPVPIAKAKLRVMLEAFYDPSSGKMRTQLRQKNLIPKKQPFNITPFNYNGAEEISHNNPDIVDWVYCEVRDINDPLKILGKTAALLDSTGLLRDPDHNDTIKFDGISSGDYLVAIYHKSHIAIMSSEAVTFSKVDPKLYDFTQNVDSAFGNNQQKEIGKIFGMRSGDFDHNGLVNNLDFNEWKKNAAALDEYLSIDADGNGIVNNFDFNLWKSNTSKLGITELRK